MGKPGQVSLVGPERRARDGTKMVSTVLSRSGRKAGDSRQHSHVGGRNIMARHDKLILIRASLGYDLLRVARPASLLFFQCLINKCLVDRSLESFGHGLGLGSPWQATIITKNLENETKKTS
jgi:hypothetical protein